MTSEPLPADCAEARRRLAEGEAADREAVDHMAGCEGCSAFATALVELEARLARLPLPEPAAGAADRAVARFRAEFAAHGSPGMVPAAPPVDTQPTPASPPLPLPSSPSPLPTSTRTAIDPQSQGSPVWRPLSKRVRRLRWRPPVGLAAGVAAAIALLVALVVAFGPTSTPPAYADILHQASLNTGAVKSARFDITGAVGLSVSGHAMTAHVSGSGATEFPNRGELTEVDTLFGSRLQEEIVSVGDRVWTRRNDGGWVLSPVPADHASPLDQALAYPAQALDDLTRVGSGYRDLGMTTVGGTRVRQIQLTIPGDSFHAFGNLPEQVSHWTVVVDVSQGSLILRRLTVTGLGTVRVVGIKVPFDYSLQLTLSDFGARVSIQPPG
jgi:hypothetical protein